MERLRQSEWEAALEYLTADAKQETSVPSRGICKADGCPSGANEAGYCPTHYRKQLAIERAGR